jgi:acetylornithine deacetylase
VVPVDGQPWSTDPWTVVEKDGRLYGRGTCDMKGFLALALAAVPDLIAAKPKKPVHLAFSYDEEIGCLGAPAMIEVIGRELPKPAFVVVGEPTDMQAVAGHKGIAVFHVTVTGREAHSSQTQQGVSAIAAAVKLTSYLTDLAERLERDADAASPFTPKGPTLTIGMINGGTAHNIIARECSFVFDLRVIPPVDPQDLLGGFFAEVKAMDVALKARAPEAGVSLHMHSNVPGFAPEPDSAAEGFARRLAADNGPVRVVSFATEAGQFQRGGLSAILCGPGSISQAHQPDEYVEISQMERGVDFMRRLTEWAAS